VNTLRERWREVRLALIVIGIAAVAIWLLNERVRGC